MTLAKTIAKNTNRKFAPHLIVNARAGTGKTTTLVEGLKIIKGFKTAFTPSPQQKAVWDSMKLSKNAKTVCFVAFNKAIATELQERVPKGCNAMTMHSMGFSAVKKVFELNSRRAVNNFRVDNILEELTGKDIRELRRNSPEFVKGTKKLVSLCKMNLIGVDVASWDTALSDLASHYGVELNGSRKRVFEMVPKVLERCKDVAKDGCIDYDDMIWLPIVLDLPIFKYDLLLVDEAQDLNMCQQELAMRAGSRLILCGDPKQAIYGFAGADSDSMPRMFNTLSNTKYGCKNLPLTVTRRCGHTIVAEAQKIVPDFEAFITNPIGTVTRAKFKGEDGADPKEDPTAASYMYAVLDGDMCLCRVNAPLVSECFKFIKQGRKANIQGRDVGQGLITTIKKMNASDLADLQGKLSDWLHNEVVKENRKRNPSDSRVIALQDKYDCLNCFMESDVKTVEEVIQKIESIFTDNKHEPGIKFSSIHKAKGLEANRVFFLEPEGATVPHPMAKSAWQREQEMNLRYVAITRAIEELIYVS